MPLPLFTCILAWYFLKHTKISASSSEIDRKFWIRHPNSSPSPHYSNNIYYTYHGFMPLPAGVLPPCTLSITCSPSTTSLVANLYTKKKNELMDKYLFPTYNCISHFPTFKSVNIKNLNHTYPLMST